MISKLNPEQNAAFKTLDGISNVFLTGAAGSGKSFVLKAYLKTRKEDERVPVLASTGAAAILVGGRTFHSFFGLGIMEGGVNKTVERAIQNKRVKKRLKKTDSVIVDEISMISGPTLRTAETIARKIRGGTSPWGGMRMIAVGDFAQLPPVNPFSETKEWAFLDDAWVQSDFKPIMLRKIMRASDPEFLSVLNDVREGQLTRRVRDFLIERSEAKPKGECTRLFPHRGTVERFNLEKLDALEGSPRSFDTTYIGAPVDIEKFQKNSPLPEVIQLKKGALVMLRQNDPDFRFVNGSLGHIAEMSDDSIEIDLLSGDTVEVKKAEFTLLNADGTPVVTAHNFPVSLAWAMTIHKAQGATLDCIRVDLSGAWEAGQAYVALSRVREPSGLFIDGWKPTSIVADPAVIAFHNTMAI